MVDPVTGNRIFVCVMQQPHFTLTIFCLHVVVEFYNALVSHVTYLRRTLHTIWGGNLNQMFIFFLSSDVLCHCPATYVRFCLLCSSLSLWGAMKKKPLFTLKNAHGSRDENENGSQSLEENWITAVAALHNTDLLASGTHSCLYNNVSTERLK